MANINAHILVLTVLTSLLLDPDSNSSMTRLLRSLRLENIGQERRSHCMSLLGSNFEAYFKSSVFHCAKHISVFVFKSTCLQSLPSSNMKPQETARQQNPIFGTIYWMGNWYFWHHFSCRMSLGFVQYLKPSLKWACVYRDSV